MGMFDYVNHAMFCPVCNHVVAGFQSKDRGSTLSVVEFWEVENFYASCNNCHAWIEFNYIHKENRQIDDYKMEVTPKESQTNPLEHKT